MPAVVFLDKDGTLVENMPYSVDPAAIRFLPGAAEALLRISRAGWRLAVVTNQSGVARGLFGETDLGLVEIRIRELLAERGVSLADFTYCPHHPEAEIERYRVDCECRKPAPGMILASAHRLGVEPSSCWMVGDDVVDIEAGRRAGCRTVLLKAPPQTSHADVAVVDWSQAAATILASENLIPSADQRAEC